MPVTSGSYHLILPGRPPGSLLLPDPHHEMVCVRPVPVEFAALLTPAEGKPVLIPRSIIRTGNLLDCRLPQFRLAQRAAAHHQPADNQPAIDQLLHLFHHLIGFHADAPPGSVLLLYPLNRTATG